MKKCCHYCRSSGLLILRLLVAAVFLYHGITKAIAGTAMAGFVGGAATNMGLTFLPETAWFWIATVGEILIGLLLILGSLTKLAGALIVIIMFFAISAKKFSFPTIEMELLLMGLGIVLIVAGPGKYSICNKEKSKDGGSCSSDKSSGCMCRRNG